METKSPVAAAIRAWANRWLTRSGAQAIGAKERVLAQALRIYRSAGALGSKVLSGVQVLIRRLPPHLSPLTLCGLLLIGLGLAYPWLGVALEPERRSISLPFVIVGLPRSSWLSYGVNGILCLLGGLANLRW